MEAIGKALQQFIYTLSAFPRAWHLIREHKLWQGLKEYKWVFRFLIVIAILTGLYLLSEYQDWSQEHTQQGVGMMFIGADSFISTLGKDTYASLTDGALKWVVLILLEVVIYHFMRRTMHVVLEHDLPDAHTFKPFLNAQIRMFAVSWAAFGLEIGLGAAGNSILGIFPVTKFLQPVYIIALQAGLLGFAIVDNFNEQFKLTIQQSLRYTYRNYIGVCLGLGLPLFLMLKVPIIGTIIGPILASVTAAIVMKEVGDLHTVGYVPSEKERQKMERKAAAANRKQQRKRRKPKKRGEEFSDEELIV